MVILNHAIAAEMVHGPKTGLDLLDGLKEDPRQANHYRLDAVRGHLLEMAGESVAAANHCRAAAGKTANLPERNYLLMQSALLTTLPTDSGCKIPDLQRQLKTSFSKFESSSVFDQSTFLTNRESGHKFPLIFSHRTN